MDILQLIYFVATVESRTLADAAERLNVSQSTLSLAIKRLETEFDVELFHKVGRKDQITHVGKVLYEGAVPILASFDELQHKITMEKKDGKNVVAVAMDAVDIGMESIIAFSKLYADVVFNPIRNSYHTLQEMLMTRHADFYLTFYKIEHSDVISELLFSEPMQLLVNKSNPLAKRKSVSIEELGQETLVMMETKYAVRKLFDGYFRAAGVSPSMIRIVGSQELMAQYVQANLGSTFISECIRNTQNASPHAITNVRDTVAVPIGEPYCKRDVYICYLNENPMPEQQRQYLQFMRDYATYIHENKALPFIGE